MHVVFFVLYEIVFPKKILFRFFETESKTGITLCEHLLDSDQSYNKIGGT